MKRLLISLPALLLPQAVGAQTSSEIALVRQLSAHVMQVHAATLGSAVAVTDHLAVTSCHVLGNATIAYLTRGSLSSYAKLKAGDTGHDLCLLELEESPGFPVAAKPAASLAPGDTIYAIGFGAARPSVGIGVVNELYPYDGGLIIRSDAAFAEGASGGGLFDHEGNLVGILTFLRRGVEASSYWAMPSEWIQPLTTAAEVDKSRPPIWAAERARSIRFLQVTGDEIDGDWKQMRVHLEQWLSEEPGSKQAIRALDLVKFRMGHAMGTPPP